MLYRLLICFLCTATLDAHHVDSLDLLLRDSVQITEKRKAELKEFAEEIGTLYSDTKEVKLLFVCTHNSRRSQLAQAWSWYIAQQLEIPGVETYSGGTESTAFNPRMVAAMQRAGFRLRSISAEPQDEKNRKYVLYSGKAEENSMVFFSKVYDHEYNPSEAFIAVMVCSDADSSCPVVNGALSRFSLPYEDPKISDGLHSEQSTYTAKVWEIGREMMYAFHIFHSTAAHSYSK